MRLHRRLLAALGTLSFILGSPAYPQESPAKNPEAISVLRQRDRDPGGLTRTGARRTQVVSAVERVKNAVVNIHSERPASPHLHDPFLAASSPKNINGMGTGIIVDPRGYIVTNQHVIDDVTILRVRLADGATYTAQVVARNPEMDLALLKIDPKGPLSVMPVGTASDLMVGETVIAIGNAYGYEHTVSVGVVSAVKRDVALNKDMAYKALVQTDASINPGNSGGPLVNIHGDLVGVNVAIRAGAQNIGFAIPADHMVRSVAEMFRSRRRGQSYDGLVVRDRLEASEDGPVRQVVVDFADAAGPAGKAGLKSGDILTQLGDVKVSCSYDVERALLDRRGGDSLAALVKRGDQEHKMDLVLGVSDRQPLRPAAVGADLAWGRLGMQLAPAPADAVRGVNQQLSGGLEVTTVQNDSVAFRAGIRKGDILVGLHNWETINLDNIHYVLTHPDLPTFNPLSFYILRSGQVRRGYLSVGN